MSEVVHTFKYSIFSIDPFTTHNMSTNRKPIFYGVCLFKKIITLSTLMLAANSYADETEVQTHVQGVEGDLHAIETAGITNPNTVVDKGSFQGNSIIVIKETESENDLSSYAVINKSNNLSFKVFFDSELEAVASQAVPILDNIYSDLAFNAGLKPFSITWAEVAFVVDKNYIPPRKDKIVRWSLVYPKTNQLSKEALKELYSFISHEQTHSIQKIMSCDFPRWFEEGQAMWNQLKVTKPWSIKIAKKERLYYKTAYQNRNGDLNLANWGGMMVKPEAIERQLTPEQKQRKKNDSSYTPPGPFHFGPDDLISDESNIQARYFISLNIFEHLEYQLGLEKLHQLFNDVYQMERCDSDSLREVIKAKYKVDLSEFFEK